LSENFKQPSHAHRLADPEKGAMAITIEVQPINRLYPYGSIHVIIVYKMIWFGKK
jgi:hypothetical protein